MAIKVKSPICKKTIMNPVQSGPAQMGGRTDSTPLAYIIFFYMAGKNGAECTKSSPKQVGNENQR